MSQEIAVREEHSHYEGSLEIPAELKKLYMETYFEGLTENDAILAFRDAERRGLSIEAKQIHFVPRFNKKAGKNIPTAQTSIDGFRLIAARTGKYGGSMNAKLTVRLKTGTKAVLPHEEYDPEEVSEIVSGTISVINKDFDQPQTATAIFKAYAQTFPDGNLMGFWQKGPDVMILKCAESLALRKSFPQELSGLYTNEEMGQLSNDDGIRRPRSTSTITETPKPEIIEVKVIEVQPEPTPVEKKSGITPQELWDRLPKLKGVNPLLGDDEIEAAQILCLMRMKVDKVEEIPLEKADALQNYIRRGLKADMKKGGMWPEAPVCPELESSGEPND
jgi:phage recombination protein Bet